MTSNEEGGASPKFSLFRLAIQRPVAVTMLTLGVVVFGLVAYSRLSVALLPKFSHPTLTIRTEYPGSAPEEVEQFVTNPLEKAVSIASGLVELRSVSRAGFSEIVLEFQWGAPLGLATLEVREKLDRLKLPDEVNKPVLLRFDPDEEPILRMALLAQAPLVQAPLGQAQSGKANLVKLREWAENEIEPRLNTLPGVAFVNVRGGAPKEVIVDLDEGRLARLGLSVAGIAGRLEEENINLAGGVLKEGRTEYRVRTLNELNSLKEMRAVLVSPPGSPPVRLGDIANVRLGEARTAVHVRAGGKQAVEIEVFKEADANIVTVANRVRKVVWGEAGNRDNPRAKTREKSPKKPGRKDWQQAGTGKVITDQLPEGMELILVYDQSKFIGQALGEVRKTAVMGALLAMVVLFLFLGRLKPTLLVLAAIPLSIIAAFLLMFITDITLNMISLGGLALGVGMLVDNTIVVLEAIHRLRERGFAPLQAALEGLKEVGGAVTASTLTTIAVFLPLVFVEGIAGQLFGDLALVVIFSLAASLLVAVFVLPMLTATLESGNSPSPESGETNLAKALAVFRQGMAEDWKAIVNSGRGLLSGLSRQEGAASPKPASRRELAALPYRALFLLVMVAHNLLVAAFRAILLGYVGLRDLFINSGKWPGLRWVGLVTSGFSRGLSRFSEGYLKLLEAALDRSKLILSIAAGLLAFFLILASTLEQELIPPLHQGVLIARLEMPPGTPLERTSRIVSALERTLMELPEVEKTFARIGEEPDSQSVERGGDNIGLIWVDLKAKKGLAEAETRAREAISEVLRKSPDLSYRIGPPRLFTLKPPIVVEIQGADLQELAQTALQVEELLRRLPEVSRPTAHLRPGHPEIRVIFNRERLAQQGLTAKAVAELIRGKLEGETALRFNTSEKKIDVRVKVSQPQLDSLKELSALTINPGRQVPIPLNAVADLRSGQGPSEIRRVSQRRTSLVTAGVTGSDLKGAVAAVSRALKGMPRPEGVSLTISGQSREMSRSMGSLFFALGLAVFLVYLVMAAQFESLLQPLVIMLSIPLAGIGVVAVMWAGGLTLDILAGIGAIVLAGIVVNNAIVLVNTINRLEKGGMKTVEAIREGALIRLRPILMTTATTVLGLLPLVLDTGAGVEIRRPIALTIIAGLLTSMLLTLIVIPCALKTLPGSGDSGRVESE